MRAMVRSVETSRHVRDRSPRADRRAHARARSGSPCTRIDERRPGRLGADRHVDTAPLRPSAPRIRKPATSRATPTTTTVRESSGGSSASGSAAVPLVGGSGSSRRTCPTASTTRPQLARDAFGHDRHRGACAALGLREAASAHESMPSTPKYSGETNWYVTVDLPARAFGATRGRPPRPAYPARPRGRNRGDRRLARHRVEQRPRASARSATSTVTISAVRIPGSTSPPPTSCAGRRPRR